MKIRPSVWTAASLVLAFGFCVFRVNSQQLQAKQAEGEHTKLPSLTPEEWKKLNKANEAYQREWERNRAENFFAVENNGSKRAGLTLEQLPEGMRAEVRQIAENYTQHIYPLLKKYTDKNKGNLPIHAGVIPEIFPYIFASGYNGDKWPRTGEVPVWSIGANTWRMDGTLIARDIYSQKAPVAPHDRWAEYANKRTVTWDGHRSGGFIVTGWDDGRVTFDPVEAQYYADVKLPNGEIQMVRAPVGSAGIPKTIPQGQQAWLDADRKKWEAAGAKFDKPAK